MKGPVVTQVQTTVVEQALEYRPRYLERLIRFAGQSKVYAPLGDELRVVVYTPYGEVWCAPGDYVVRDRHGNLSVEAPEDFTAIYSPVEDLTGV